MRVLFDRIRPYKLDRSSGMTPSSTEQGMVSGKRDLSITRRLLFMTIGVVVPIIGFSAFLIIRYAESERAAIEANVRQSLRGFAIDVDRELAGAARAARLLAAASIRLRTADLEGFQRQAREAVKLEGIEITLSDKSGQILVDTAKDYGEALPKLTDSSRFDAAFAVTAPRISGIIMSEVLQRPVIAIDVPIRNAENGTPYLLSVGVAPSTFQKILEDQRLPAAWTGAIADQAGRFIARSIDAERLVGQPLTPGFLSHMTGREGSFQNVNRDNVTVLSSFARLSGSDWVVVIAVPERVLVAPLRNLLLGIVFGAGGTLLLAAGAALWNGRLIARPFRWVARSALAIAGDDRPTMPPPGVLEATEVGTALVATYDMLRRNEAEKRASEQRLQDSEALRREALDAAEIGTWSIALPRRERVWDENLRKLCGIALDAPASEAVLNSVVHPADLSRLIAVTEQIFKAERPLSVDFRVIAPDKAEHWLRLKGGVARYDDDGMPMTARGVIMKIDALKQNERELRESQDRYRAIVESAIDSIIVIDAAGRIQAFNKSAETMLGYSASEAVGQNVSMLMPLDEATRHDGYIERYLRTNEARVIGIGREVEVRRKDGTLFPADLALVEWWAGGVRYFTGILRDLTQRRADERARVKLEEQLRQSQKMEAIGQLTGGIAHDFNNLLLAISLNIETLDEEFADHTGAKPLIEGAMFATDQARTLIGQLLAFGRRQTLDVTTFDVNDVVLDMIAILRRTVQANIAIETVLPPDVWPVLADRQQLETALLNLVLNARDAMPASGRLVIETSNVALDAEFAAQNPGTTPGRYVIMSVSDTGSGMSPEVLARAFEPFYTTKKTGEGTGLGLSQVYGYIKQSGGHAKIYSEPGHGTTVKLYLPSSTQEPAPSSQSAERRALPGSGETILMVEDTALVRNAVRRMLVSLGYQVIDVITGQEAIDVLQSDKRIDLLFTDMILPGGVDGNELALAAQRLRPGIRILLTSGYTQTRALPTAPDGSTNLPLISKPYTKAELAERLAQVFAT
jgi:PAS domain S-box-containing protein